VGRAPIHRGKSHLSLLERQVRKGRIRVATVQFSENWDPRRNAAIIRKYLIAAKKRRADIVHFHEGALSGYLGVEKKAPPPEKVHWQAVREGVESVCAQARRCRLWVVLGSAHRLTPPHKPHNSLYLISPRGKVVDRYDKRFCTEGDLKAYSPGDHLVTFVLNGVKCALLICYELRFPELYRRLRRLGVQVIFQSFHNGYHKGPGIHAKIMRQTVQAHAGINYFWISANNSSAYYSAWPSVLITPDGAIAASLRQNVPGIMINTVNTRKKYYDASDRFRDLAMRGATHNGRCVKDTRSRDRTCV
jgi:predicted amidohydrolase